MANWTSEERNKILKHWVKKYKLTTDDFKELHADMPERSASQIRDQYIKFLKPLILGLYQEASSSSASSTPSPAKRSRTKEESDNV